MRFEPVDDTPIIAHFQPVVHWKEKDQRGFRWSSVSIPQPSLKQAMPEHTWPALYGTVNVSQVSTFWLGSYTYPARLTSVTQN